MFSFKSCIVLALTCESMIDFELTCIYVNICCEIGVQLHSWTPGIWISIVPASFGEKMILFLLNCLGTLVEDQVTVASSYSLTAILSSVKLLSPSKSNFFFNLQITAIPRAQSMVGLL